ncbi:uncharacterized protein LOC126882338 [Diabrotica virgifera virgifera]|uniref:Uncharacterized protein n=1 Tax=Diabrotica virgifera virgifera TaxID=50390 RepID=A0ABM5JZ25_DIAVI|nr:uncharacterized protein LOC126882338 [Diabrotica virgifera virgifera]XP_050503193.1 uncharacterized protein LOC126882338 [Diabrotica virgifera virgifera]
MSVTRSQSKDNKKQKEHSNQENNSDQEDILDTTIMASEQQELSGIDKLLQMMQLHSQRMEQKMDEIQQKLDDNQKEIKSKIKEITNCQKKEIENLKNKLKNAIQVDREEVEKRITEIEKQVTENRTQQNVGERREMVIHSTDDVKIRFGGDVRRLHPVPFINSLKEEVNLTNLIYKIPRVNLVGSNKRTLATINEGIRVMVRLGKKMYALQCVIMPNMSHDMIVGVDELAEKHVVIEFKNNTMNLTEEKEE